MTSVDLARRRLLAGAAAAILAPGVASGQAPIPPQHQVRALRLTRGLLVSGWLESLPGDEEGIRRQLETRYQPEDFTAMRTLGFNNARIALDPRFVAPRLADGDPSPDQQRLELLDAALGRVTRTGMSVVLANRMPAELQERCASDAQVRAAVARTLEALATHVAQTARYHVDGTFLELFSKPERWFEEAELYRATLEQFLAAARRGAPDHTLIVGGNRWNAIEGITAGLRTPLADGNLIYSFHFYHPLEFTLQGFEPAGSLYAKLRNVPWDVDARALSDAEIDRHDDSVRPALREYNEKSHRRADLEGPFAAMRRWCDDHGQVGWLGEFGVHREGVQGQHRIAWTHHVRELAEQHKFGWNMAELQGPFGLFLPGEARPLRPDRPLLRALGL